jgi:hypothetical protein
MQQSRALTLAGVTLHALHCLLLLLLLLLLQAAHQGDPGGVRGAAQHNPHNFW